MNREDLFNQKKSFHLDDFTIKGQIGMGKFGAVFKAIEKKSQIVVAIKIIPKKTIASQILYTQLRRQIEIQSRLKHTSICELYAYFHDTNNVFMVLEYCPQGSLAFLVKQKKQVLASNKIASIFQQLVYGLAYMHARHVMHRDLKLQNILLDQENNIKISDFGWCVHHPSSRHTFCGTMEYISPQMLNKESYEHSIDVYCLGIILYELFYFRSPFLGENQAETIKNIKEGNLVFDDEVRLVDNEAKILIEKLLDRDPLKRPKARELFEDEFILKYYRSSSQSRRQRRLTQQTFREFKQEFFKQSQKQSQSQQSVEQVQLVHASAQEKVDQPKGIFVIQENEENENETTLLQQLEQAKESMTIPNQGQIIQNGNESQQKQHVSQQENLILEATEQSATKLQKRQAKAEQKQPENTQIEIQIETNISIEQGLPENTQQND